MLVDSGIGFERHSTGPTLAPVQDAVQLGAVAVYGVNRNVDPRVGIFGAPYGGGIALSSQWWDCPLLTQTMSLV